MKNRLESANAMVVGANSHVGRAILKELVDRGAQKLVGTFLPDHRNTGVGIEKVRKQIGSMADFSAIELDQTNDDEVRQAVQRAAGQMGGFDILVTAASRQSEESHFDMSAEEMRQQVDVNLFGTMCVIREGSKKMMDLATAENEKKRHRSIGVVTSIRGVEPLSCTGYDAAKAGLIQHVRSASSELGPYGISINGVAPGTIDAPIEYKRHGCAAEEYRDRWAPLTPFGGTPVTPEMVAEELCNLLNSGGVTGQIVCVDGGFGNMRPLPDRGGKE